MKENPYIPGMPDGRNDRELYDFLQGNGQVMRRTFPLQTNFLPLV
jgi:hypothetical protein